MGGFHARTRASDRTPTGQAAPGGFEQNETAVSEKMAAQDAKASNQTKAATAARTNVHPRGGVEQSETAVSEKMVGPAGLEPATKPL